MPGRRRRPHMRRRRGRARTTPSTSIAGYTRSIDLNLAAPAADATGLVTLDFPDVHNTEGETVNRKILRVAGRGIFTAALAAGNYAMAQFCLWAHPKHEDWPSVSEYDPFHDGPGESAFEGMLAPRAFCRRTMVLASPASGTAETITQDHVIRSKAERLLRPGWVLSCGLYVRGTSGVNVRHTALLRAVVAG